jgi:hypothetical protein
MSTRSNTLKRQSQLSHYGATNDGNKIINLMRTVQEQTTLTIIYVSPK